MNRLPNDSSTLPPEEAQRVDEICDRFESAWKAWQSQARPALEDFIAGTEGTVRSALFRELLRVELAYRRPDSFPFWRLDLSRRFPGQEALIETALAEAGLGRGQPSRYRMLRPHKEGGLGEVWVALDEELHREVALKQIKEQHADQPERRRRFLLEAEITGGLEHPGVIPIYGLGQNANGRPYYAMRFIRGEDLREAIRRFHQADDPSRDPAERSLALRALLSRFLDVCNAVDYAHSRGVLHRDLKPQNVMLGPYGETLVVDWGLAKLFDSDETALPGDPGPLQPMSSSDSTPTEPHAAIGTPAYMAPEQADRRHDLIEVRTDVYLLGGILYEILTNQPPHPRGRRSSDPPQPSAAKPGIPAALEAVVARAMQPAREERYRNARMLAGDVHRWLAEEPIEAFRAYVRQFESLSADHPKVAEYTEQLARHRTNLALVLTAVGRHVDAEAAIRQARAEFEALAVSHPQAARYRAEVATTRIHFSRILRALLRPADADEEERKAIQEYDKLMSLRPEEYQTNMASVMLTWTGQVDQAPSSRDELPKTGEYSKAESAGKTSADADEPQTLKPEEAGPRPSGETPELRARLTMIRQLGSGGFSHIWLARDHDLNREVVVKELRPHADRSWFFREAQITAQLEHPNIVPVYGLGYRSQDERPLLIMRYFPGRTLAQAVNEFHAQAKGGAWDSEEFLRLLRAFALACRGVAYAHGRGVIHRDPKPANILLDESGEVMVVDWGLAKAGGHAELPAGPVTVTAWAETETQEGQIFGTPAYMAPEMAEGRLDDVDPQSDVYVLGASLFNLLTGQHPYSGGSPMELLTRIRDARQSPRPRAVNAAVPTALDNICARAMARNKAARYSSALHLARDVESWITDQGKSSVWRWITSLWGS
jgi:serine/threonine protein kinase